MSKIDSIIRDYEYWQDVFLQRAMLGDFPKDELWRLREGFERLEEYFSIDSVYPKGLNRRKHFIQIMKRAELGDKCVDLPPEDYRERAEIGERAIVRMDTEIYIVLYGELHKIASIIRDLYISLRMARLGLDVVTTIRERMRLWKRPDGIPYAYEREPEGRYYGKEGIREFEEAIYDLRSHYDGVSGTKMMKQVIDPLYNKIKSRTDEDRIDSGYKRLDSLTGGFNPGELIIIAGRPGMGKTAFALNLFRNIAEQRICVAFFSFEMSSEQICFRLLAMETGVPIFRLRNGSVRNSEVPDVEDATKYLEKLPMYLDDRPGCTCSRLKSAIKKLSRGEKVRFVIIDYLHLMKSSFKVQDRVKEISDISASLKNLAMELKIPVIALSQLSRNVEMREDKRPRLSDLRDSGTIEQDADKVIFLYRQEYYKRDDEGGVADVILDKNRSGEVGMSRMRFYKDTGKFVEIVKKNH